MHGDHAPETSLPACRGFGELHELPREKKKQSVEKMVGKLAPQKNEAATKSFDLKSQHVQCTLYFYMF